MRQLAVAAGITLGFGLAFGLGRPVRAETPVAPPPAFAPPPAAAPPAAAPAPEPAPPPEVTLPPEAAPPPEVAPPAPVPPPPAPEISPPPAVAPSPPAIVAEEISYEAPPPRPRLSLAVGMGATLDPAGFPDGTHPLPTFVAEGGFGDGLTGFDLGAYSTSASGRFSTLNTSDFPVDRLALDAFGVLRPAARWHRDDQRYRMRLLHLLAVELGLGFERDGTPSGSGTRFVIHTGARAEFPLTAGPTSELRLRLGVRRAVGLYTPVVAVGGATGGQTLAVGD